MSLSRLRTILQQKEPDFANFMKLLEELKLEKGDEDILLRKVVESRVINFADYCKILVSKGANINFFDSKENVSNLMIACQRGTFQMVKTLTSYKQINLFHVDMRKRNATFYSIENKSKQDSQSILRLLLDRAPELVNKENNNQTLLTTAIQKNKVQIVKLLLEKGANPNQKVTDTENTALHDAVKQMKSKCTSGIKEIIKMLLLNGGDSLLKNKQNKTVFDYAEKAVQEYKKIVQQVNPLQGESQDYSPKNNQPKKSLEIPRNIKRESETQPSKVLQQKQNNNKKVQEHPLLMLNSSQDISRVMKNANEIYNRYEQNGKDLLHEKNHERFSSSEEERQQIENKKRYYLKQFDPTFEFATQKHFHQPLIHTSSQEDYSKAFQDADQIYSKYEQKKSSSPSKIQEPFEEEEEVIEDIKNIFNDEQDVVDELSKEILDFEEQCVKDYSNAINQVNSFIDKFRKLVVEEKLEVEQYGSFATGLWLKNCDIDLLLIPPMDIYEITNQMIEDYLDKVHTLLKKSNICRNILINKKVRVPMIRAEIPIENSNKTRKIDMTIIDRNHNGRSIAHFVKEQLRIYPQLRPMFFTIKTLSYHFKLNDPKNGGIRTYAIIIMLLSRIANWNESKLGKLLLDFLYYFGFYYEYNYEIKGEKEYNDANINPDFNNFEAFQTEKMVLNIIDPLSANNNIGKNANASELQKMFRAAYLSLHTNFPKKRLSFMFDLKRIFALS